MNVETYAYLKEPVLTDIFETPDTGYIISSPAGSCQVALLHWLSTMLAPGELSSVELDIKHAKNLLMDNDCACEATLCWPTEYPDLKLHLYVERLPLTMMGMAATHDDGHVYRVIIQPVDEAPEE